jgi:hypothetical protein
MNAARIEFDYIAINTNLWIAAHVGDKIQDLTDLFEAFDTALSEVRHVGAISAELFITARVGPGWRTAEHAIITSARGGTVNLTDDIVIYRYADPVYGDVALIATEDHGFTGRFTAYPDSCTDPADWYDFHDVEIHCPAGHSWTLRAGELIDAEGSAHRVEEVFPSRDVVTTDLDLDSASYGEARILCPTCGRHCELATPHLA